uniref:SJCHGC05319 protein n=1 Tax=Schistosoma japonicum TaxID=6182 RepID=Q5DEM6_SCHJA|nr:SJCHGC05319 protein [Schistosoma japonicum]
MMYPHNPYFGLTPQYYGFVGIAPIAPIAIPPPPLVTVPTVIPPPNVAAPVVTTVAETQFYVREKPPVTTVFVGNIAECAPDQLIKTLLMRCGNILSWKRVQGASGKLQAFGFCEYEDPESTMRCVRLLNGFKVGPKPLLVKVDPKTEDLLNEYRKKKEKVGEEGTLGATPDEIDQSTQRDDETVKTALENIIKENAAMLEEEGGAKKQDLHMEGPRHLTIEDMDLDNDRKDLINREIESFRKRNEKGDQNDNKQSRSKVQILDVQAQQTCSYTQHIR